MRGRTFQSNLTGVGQERDFYKLEEMLASDIEIVRSTLISRAANPAAKRAAEAWIELFQIVPAVRKLASDSGLDVHEALKPLYIELEEHLHGHIERNAIPLLSRLVNAHEFCLTDDGDYVTFIHYLMTQYFRTSRIKENLKRNLDEVVPGYVDRSIGVIRHVVATTTSWTLIADRDRFRPRLLTNRTSIPFITGDQPVINLVAADVGFESIVVDCEFYYPLSPRKALVVGASDNYSSGSVEDENLVRGFNRSIAKSAEKQIYAEQSHHLRDYAELVGSHRAQVGLIEP